MAGDIASAETPKGITIDVDKPMGRTLTPAEIANTAAGIRSVWGEDEEFQRRSQEEIGIASVILNAVLAGEMSKEEAAEILGTKSAESQLAREVDFLTGLPNRGGLEKRLTETLAIAKRNGLSVAIGFADLDDFKVINDNEDKGGHDRGDAVLSSWGGAISTGFRRDTDYAGRYGGEEIVFVFLNADEAWAAEHLRQLAQSMPSEIIEAVHEVGFELDASPTMTVGVVAEKLDTKDEREPAQIAKDLIKKADERMYLGKRNGKNTVVDTARERIITDSNSMVKT